VAAKLSDFHGFEMSPFALYNLANLPLTDIENLATTLDKHRITSTEPNVIHFDIMMGGELN
jgi:hypothetical protein